MTKHQHRTTRRIHWLQIARDGLPIHPLGGLVDTGVAETHLVAEIIATSNELISRLQLRRGGDVISGFEMAVDGWEDRARRRAALRIVELLADGDRVDTLDTICWDAAGKYLHGRPLTDMEQVAARVASYTTEAPAATLGLYEAGAWPSELARIAPGSVTADGSEVLLPGTSSSRGSVPKLPERTVQIPRWCRKHVLRTRLVNERSDLLLHHGRTTPLDRVVSTLAMRVRAVYGLAGFQADPTVKPMSARNGTARILCERFGVEAAMQSLGHDNAEIVRRLAGLA
jgi:hypothetical protein